MTLYIASKSEQKDYSPKISDGLLTNIVPPCCIKKSLSRNPQSTLIHGNPQFLAVIISTSLSPIYTAPSFDAPNCRRASNTVSGAGFFLIVSRSPIATSIVSGKNVLQGLVLLHRTYCLQ